MLAGSSLERLPQLRSVALQVLHLMLVVVRLPLALLHGMGRTGQTPDSLVSLGPLSAPVVTQLLRRV